MNSEILLNNSGTILFEFASQMINNNMFLL